ncbi:MAG: DUF424 family protein [Candidatus Undinarchaeales archaeon]
MISVKVQGKGSEQVLAACDEELLGKTFSEGSLKLEVSKSFYGGDKMEIETFAELLEKATNSNLVGEKTVTKAVELGLVLKDSIVKIQNIPHVQILKL